MSDEVIDTVQLQRWVAGLQCKDQQLANELVQRVCAQVEKLTRKMLGQDPRVHRWEQTGDVLQNVFVRLLRALRSVTPGSRREFFALATLQIRHELCDLARHYYGPCGLGAKHASLPPKEGSVSPMAAVAEQCEDPEKLEMWTEFHDRVKALPEEEREVFELVYYHQVKQQDIAEMLEISTDTVSRRWKRAIVILSRQLGNKMPEV